jgi:hypothetical protein
VASWCSCAAARPGPLRVGRGSEPPRHLNIALRYHHLWAGLSAANAPPYVHNCPSTIQMHPHKLHPGVRPESLARQVANWICIITCIVTGWLRVPHASLSVLGMGELAGGASKAEMGLSSKFTPSAVPLQASITTLHYQVTRNLVA